MQGLHTGVWFLEVFGRYERGAPVPDKRVLAVTWAPPGRVYTKPSQELHRINQLLGEARDAARSRVFENNGPHVCRSDSRKQFWCHFANYLAQLFARYLA
jgi:hypothetical protein